MRLALVLVTICSFHEILQGLYKQSWLPDLHLRAKDAAVETCALPSLSLAAALATRPRKGQQPRPSPAAKTSQLLIRRGKLLMFRCRSVPEHEVVA